MLTFYIIIIIYFLFCVQPATGKIYVFDHFPAVVSSIVHTLCDYTTKYNTLTSLYFHNPVNSCQLLLLIPAISARNRNKNGVVIPDIADIHYVHCHRLFLSLLSSHHCTLRTSMYRYSHFPYQIPYSQMEDPDKSGKVCSRHIPGNCPIHRQR